MKRNIEIHDVRYMMTLKDMRKNICFRVYDYFGLGTTSRKRTHKIDKF